MAKGIGTLGITSMGNLNEQIAPKAAFKAQLLSGASAILGPVIDRLRFDCCLVVIAWGNNDVTGTAASAESFVTKLRHGANSDGTTSWADVTAGSGGSVASVTYTDPTTATVSTSFYDLSHLERYIRLSITPTFTGGSSPTRAASAVIIPGAYRGELPAS